MMSPLSSIYLQSISFAEKFIRRELTPQQKKISILAFFALSCLAVAIYSFYSFYFKRQKDEVLKEADDEKIHENFSEVGACRENQLDLKQEDSMIVKEVNKESILLENFSDEILINICSYLDHTERMNLSRVNKKFFHFHSSSEQKIIASIIEKDSKMSVDQKFELVKKAGPFLNKLDLSRSTIDNQKLKEFLAYCPNITDLNLENCKNLEDERINFPQSLLSLNLSRTKMGNEILKDLPKNLRNLEMRQCELTGQIQNALPQSLRSVNFYNCRNLQNCIIEKLPAGLKVLNLSDCDSLESLENIHLNVLEKLDLSNCEKIVKIEFLSENQKLKELFLPKNISSSIMKSLPQSLQTLIIQDCQFIDEDFNYLPSNLQSLMLFGCPNLTDQVISKFPKSLQILALHKCHQFTDKALMNLPKDLKSLAVYKGRQFSENAFNQLPQNLNSLLIAVGKNIKKFTIPSLPHLQNLVLQKSKSLTHESFHTIPASVKNLIIEECDELTEQFIEKLPISLELLSITECYQLSLFSDSIIDKIPPNLQFLNLDIEDNQLLSKICQKFPNINLDVKEFEQKISIQMFPFL